MIPMQPKIYFLPNLEKLDIDKIQSFDSLTSVFNPIFVYLQYALYIPALAILMKVPILILDRYLTKIRSGWERNNKWSSTRAGHASAAEPVKSGTVNMGMEMA